MTTIGAACTPYVPPEVLREAARAAEDAGLDELWLWEDCFRGGGISSAAAVLAWTTRLRVGIGVLPVPQRNVALTAMETAMLHRLFPGRVTVGVGHGVQGLDAAGRRVRGIAADAAARAADRAARAAARRARDRARPLRALGRRASPGDCRLSNRSGLPRRR
jgi:alkanesulfonate monooxygenase SsuD/methylene tetrahydromethanopterin reductase-like flavin-dependent oxidoreductase (luciferase family)